LFDLLFYCTLFFIIFCFLALHYSASENTLFQPCIWPPQFAASGEAIAGSMRSISPQRQNIEPLLELL
jgi:hypothetical protein